jgi:fibronectin type 3 domain-containing protein
MPARWQQQFSATVSGSSNTGVTWKMSQGTGNITQAGLYTAPSFAEIDIVTAISQADTTKSATATVTVAAPHSVTLNWSASSTAGVTYDVYRGTISGGPYSLLSSNLTSTTYKDANVQSGSTYYYVVTAVDSAGQSPYSNMVQAAIPMP